MFLRSEVRAAVTFPDQSVGWAILSIGTQMHPGRAPSLPLPVFHRPVTSRLFHLWKQLLSLPSLRSSSPPPPTPFPLRAMASTPAHVELPCSSFIKSRARGGSEVGAGFPRGGWRGRWGVVRRAVDGRWMVDFLFMLRRLCRQRYRGRGEEGVRDRRGASGQFMYKCSAKIHRVYVTKLCWCQPQEVELEGLSV